MGLINNIVIGLVHLLFVVMDILFVMILIRLVYQRCQPEWLRQINNTVEPLIVSVMGFVDKAVRRITGKTFPENNLALVTIVSMSVLRFVICALV